MTTTTKKFGTITINFAIPQAQYDRMDDEDLEEQSELLEDIQDMLNDVLAQKISDHNSPLTFSVTD